MNVDRFKSIRFGDSSAESERSNNPKLLLEGFLDTYGYIDEVTSSQKFLIYGQKGAGKSAICSRIELISEKNRYNVKTYTLQRFNYQNFEAMDSHKEAPEIRAVRSWETTLHIALLELFSKDEGLKSNSKTNMVNKVINGLKEINILPAGDLVSIVKKASKSELKINAKIAEYAKETNVEFYTNMYDNLRLAVHDAKLSKKSIILIDGLDSIMTDRENQKRTLSALFSAISQINQELKNYGIDAKVAVFCRTDILDTLNGPDLQKIIDDYSIELDWYPEGALNEDINLIKLLNLRAELSLGCKVNIFEEFFSTHIGEKKTFKFVLDYTRYIPRDLIRLMNEIQKKYKYKMDAIDFFRAINEYSAKYLYGELKNELYGIISEEDIENMFKLLSAMGTYRTSKVKLDSKSKELKITIDLNRVLPLLFNIGVIGNVRVTDAGDRYSFKFRERHSDFNPYDEIVVHLALQNMLKIRGGYTDAKYFEYD